MKNSDVIFDIDGTLFDTKPGIFNALEDVFCEFKLGFFDRSLGDKYIGPPIIDSLIKFNNLSFEQASQATRYYRSVYVNKYITDSMLYDGVLQLLHNFNENGNRLSIATMKTCLQVDVLFNLFNIDRNLFYMVETASELNKTTKSQMLINIKNQVGHVDNIVMVGDTYGDFNASTKSGVDFIGVTYGYEFKSNIEYSFPVADSVNDIYSLVNELFVE